jgi:hypothetical protein
MNLPSPGFAGFHNGLPPMRIVQFEDKWLRDGGSIIIDDGEIGDKGT